jgi:hypothetical protein
VTTDLEVSVEGFEVSPDGAWIAFDGGSPERYERNITGAGLYEDLFLMEVATGAIERLTENYEVSEGGRLLLAGLALDRLLGAGRHDAVHDDGEQVYLREVADRGGDFRKLGATSTSPSRSGSGPRTAGTIYFNAGVKVTRQLHALDTRTGAVTQLTDQRASLSVNAGRGLGRPHGRLLRTRRPPRRSSRHAPAWTTSPIGTPGPSS